MPARCLLIAERKELFENSPTCWLRISDTPPNRSEPIDGDDSDNWMTMQAFAASEGISQKLVSTLVARYQPAAKKKAKYRVYDPDVLEELLHRYGPPEDTTLNTEIVASYPAWIARKVKETLKPVWKLGTYAAYPTPEVAFLVGALRIARSAETAERRRRDHEENAKYYDGKGGFKWTQPEKTTSSGSKTARQVPEQSTMATMSASETSPVSQS